MNRYVKFKCFFRPFHLFLEILFVEDISSLDRCKINMAVEGFYLKNAFAKNSNQ